MPPSEPSHEEAVELLPCVSLKDVPARLVLDLLGLAAQQRLRLRLRAGRRRASK